MCCETCGESFSQRSNLKRHVESAHKQVKKFQHEHCESSFGQKEKLNKHIINHCNTKFMKSFKCITCEKSFITKQALRGHESSHQTSNSSFENKRQVCDNNAFYFVP